MRLQPIKIENPDRFFEFVFQNHFVAVSEIMVEKNDIYIQALDEIDLIMLLIEEELNHRLN